MEHKNRPPGHRRSRHDQSIHHVYEPNPGSFEEWNGHLVD